MWYVESAVEWLGGALGNAKGKASHGRGHRGVGPGVVGHGGITPVLATYAAAEGCCVK